MKTVVVGGVLVWVSLAACGQDDRERICEAAHGCGALASANVGACVSALEAIDAERALAECAACLETETCAAIADGACSANCGPFGAALSTGGAGVPGTKTPSQLTPAELTTFCRYMVDAQGGPGRMENCGDFSVSVPTYAACENDALGLCQRPISEYETCLEMVDSPCDVFSTSACAPLLQCGS